jgi:excinuclease ABC subunit C
MAFTVVETEHDALLLESTLIKKIQPRYNVMLKDGKSYTYICVKKERFPRVFFTRRVIKDGSLYLGPYTSKHNANIILELIKRLFPLRNCSFDLSQKNIEKGKFKVCLEYHIKNCKGPCEGYESEEDYNEKIAQVKNILKGNFKPVKDYINLQMQRCIETLNFEEAQDYKDKLMAFENYQSKSIVASTTIADLDVFNIKNDEEFAYVNYLKIINGSLINTDTIELKKNLNDDEAELLAFAIDAFREKFNSIAKEILVPYHVNIIDKDIKVTIPKIGDKRHLLDLGAKNLYYYLLQKRKNEINKIKKQTSSERILKTLQSDLQMDEIPFHIECFDNSNIQGTNPVSSCVVFKNAKPSKKDYRKFNIKTVVGPDDFASMKEVVERRYTRLIKEDQPLPQLVIIDGGKGQLSASYEILKRLGIEEKIKLIGIAKRLEEIYFPTDPIPLYINKKSESLKLIQQLRNEAHRFAINFHRDQRSKNFIDSELLKIKGIGEKTAEKLLQHFGSTKRVQEATELEIAEIVGEKSAKIVFSHFIGRI